MLSTVHKAHGLGVECAYLLRPFSVWLRRAASCRTPAACTTPSRAPPSCSRTTAAAAALSAAVEASAAMMVTAALLESSDCSWRAAGLPGAASAGFPVLPSSSSCPTPCWFTSHVATSRPSAPVPPVISTGPEPTPVEAAALRPGQAGWGADTTTLPTADACREQTPQNVVCVSACHNGAARRACLHERQL